MMQKFIIFILYTGIHKVYSDSYNEDGWKEAARYLSEGLDTSKDPCEDFYGFMCGKWPEKFGSAIMTREYSKAAKEAAVKMTSALNKYKSEKVEDLDEYKKSLIYFVENCKTKLPASDTELIHDIYKSLDEYFVPKIIVRANGTDKMPWEIDDDSLIWHFAGVLLREQDTPFLIDISLETMLENCTEKPIMRIGPPERISRDPLDQSVLNILLKQVIGYHNVSYDEQEIKETRLDILSFESDLKQLLSGATPGGELRQVSLAVLPERVPTVDWDHYFEALLPDEFRSSWLSNIKKPVVNVRHLRYFNGIMDVIRKHKNETVYNYGYALVVQRYYNMFKKNTKPTMDEIYSGFAYSNILQTENPCLYLAFQYLPSATARFVFDVHEIDTNEWRYGLNLMAETIFSAFRYLVYSVDWMDSSDKVLINEKISNIWFKHVIPEWLNSIESVNGKTPKYDFNQSLIANDILTRREIFETRMQPLISGEMNEQPPEFKVNAHYSMRTVTVLLGMMLPPIYNNKYPLSVRYGGAGWVIAHELLHGFDAHHIKFEKYPGAPRWLKPETLKQYAQRAQCFTQQYSKYCFKEAGACVQGHVSLNDNIADVEGLKTAFAAYKFQAQINDEVDKPLPGILQNYTHDQLFFMSMGRQWCNSLKPHELKNLSFSNHAPEHTRVDLPVTNIRSFAKAFKCRVGSRHAPIKTCSLWGSIWDV